MTPGPMLLIAALAMGVAVLTGGVAPRFWLSANLIGAGAALIAAATVLINGAAWDWHSALTIGGEICHLRLDSISALFVALLALVGGLGTAYAREYWAENAHPRSAGAGRVWWSILVAAIGLVLLSANGLYFLIAWEMLAVASYFLITLDRSKTEVRAAGWLYLAASHASTLCLFAYFSILAARTGSWELGSLRAAGQSDAELAPLFWLALAGFGLKAGLFPLHIWLPSAHASAPSHVSAIMSGVTIKVGIYGLVRFSGWLPVPAAAGWVVAILGVASAVLGVAFALGQHDLKRLLAYHSVENIGIILIGFGFALIARHQDNAAWGQIALVGGLLHVWNHGLFKSLLFLGAGSVLHATGTREMSRLGGLWRAMPWTTALFAFGAVAISGLPPLNGFVSEWLVYLGLFDAVAFHGLPGLAAVFAVVSLAITGALALACFVKVCGVVFLGAPRTAASADAHESGLFMRVPMIVLATACGAIGLLPAVFWSAIARAAALWNPAWSEIRPPESLNRLGSFHVALALMAVLAIALLRRRLRQNAVRPALTWDCGYAVPTARMQYTAGSLAGIITSWFAWILRPERHEQRPLAAFPAHASFDEHTPETVLVHVLEPVGRAVQGVADLVRRLQHGRLQAYLVYLVVGLAILGGMVLLGGSP